MVSTWARVFRVSHGPFWQPLTAPKRHLKQCASRPKTDLSMSQQTPANRFECREKSLKDRKYFFFWFLFKLKKNKKQQVILEFHIGSGGFRLAGRDSRPEQEVAGGIVERHTSAHLHLLLHPTVMMIRVSRDMPECSPSNLSTCHAPLSDIYACVYICVYTYTLYIYIYMYMCMKTHTHAYEYIRCTTVRSCSGDSVWKAGTIRSCFRDSEGPFRFWESNIGDFVFGGCPTRFSEMYSPRISSQMTESGPWEWGSLYKGLSVGQTFVHKEVCQKYTKVSAHGTPVYFQRNLSENLRTPVKTCKSRLWGLKWKLENLQVTGTPVKIWNGGSSNFRIGFHGSKRESHAPKTWYIFGKPLYVQWFAPTEKPLYKEAHSHGPDSDSLVLWEEWRIFEIHMYVCIHINLYIYAHPCTKKFRDWFSSSFAPVWHFGQKCQWDDNVTKQVEYGCIGWG